MRTPPNWLELDWDALKHNARAVQDYIGAERTLWAVVKADAYGHNAAQATNALLQAGVAHFIVASLDEAVALREALPQQTFRLMTLYPPTTPDEWRTAEHAGGSAINSTDPISQLLSDGGIILRRDAISFVESREMKKVGTCELRFTFALKLTTLRSYPR